MAAPDFPALLASSSADALDSPKFAAYLDSQDELASIRDEFIFPSRRTVGATSAEHGAFVHGAWRRELTSSPQLRRRPSTSVAVRLAAAHLYCRH
jgi:hypothetical protein